MRGAYLLSRDTGFFQDFGDFIKTLGYPYDETPNSVRVNASGTTYLAFYDRMENASFFEDNEIPPEASMAGYIYGYLAECRDEKMFCNVIKAAGSSFDFVVCDADGVIHRPDEIDPDRILL